MPIRSKSVQRVHKPLSKCIKLPLKSHKDFGFTRVKHFDARVVRQSAFEHQIRAIIFTSLKPRNVLITDVKGARHLFAARKSKES